MDLKFFFNVLLFAITKASLINGDINSTILIPNNDIPDDVFNGVYSDCFLHLSYPCLQNKTLLYLIELNNLSEVSVIGDYVKFVKINKSVEEGDDEDSKSGDTEELAFRIDKAIDNFFDNHVLKVYALGRNITMPRNVEEFVGRKKRKGGGGGGGGHDGGHDDGKKKMMMMAMMCMKMKLMVMAPAMMGMMGMMSFKGMMFSMMSFMVSKMMLLMKILEKKGGGGGLGGGGGGGGDGGWAAGGAGGGAWMPAGGQDYAAGGGGGYDANGQWQSRSIVENLESYKTIETNPKITIVKPIDGREWQRAESITNNKTPDSVKWKRKTIENKPVITFVTPIDNSQWHSSYIDENHGQAIGNKPEISFIKRAVRFNNQLEKESYKKPVLVYKKSNVNFDIDNPENVIGLYESNDDTKNSNLRFKRDLVHGEQTNYLDHELPLQIDGDFDDKNHKHIKTENTNKMNDKKTKLISRKKRGIIDLLQNSYIYWVNKILGLNNNRRTNTQRYKIVNGIKYVYYPHRVQKPKMPKEIHMGETQIQDLKTLVAVEDFNKGEIVEGGMESRMNKKKFNKMKDSVNDTVEDNPWE